MKHLYTGTHSVHGLRLHLEREEDVSKKSSEDKEEEAE